MADRLREDGAAPELEAGRVGRPHGLDGSFYVTRAKARLLSVGAGVRVGARTAAIVRCAGTEQKPIVRLEGVEDRPAAETMRGMALMVKVTEAPALDEGEWWAHELEGCEVVAGDTRLGIVGRMIELPSCEVLEVHREQGGEPLLVPMVKDAIRRVETSRGRIEVDPDFLDLSESSRDPHGREAPQKRGERAGRDERGESS
jgi:16S rRNA processing protein RimM